MSNCKNCGAEVPQTKGKRKREFCDNKTCRTAYWKKQNPKSAEDWERELNKILAKTKDERKKVWDHISIHNCGIIEVTPEGVRSVDPMTNEGHALLTKYLSKNKMKKYEPHLSNSDKSVNWKQPVETSEEIKLPIGNTIHLPANESTTPPDIEQIKAQIASIKAEKIPKERDTPLGKRIWENDQKKRIAILQSQLPIVTPGRSK